MIDFLGVTENFTALEHLPWSMRWRFSDAWSDEAVSVDGVTFAGCVFVGAEREAVEMDIAKGEREHEVVVGCTGLPEGRWPYEIFCTGDDGVRLRMVSGHIGVIGALEGRAMLEEMGPYVERTLAVRLPGDKARFLRLEWMASTLAQGAAASAWEACKKTEETAVKIEQAEGKLDELTERADHAMEELGKVDGLMEELHGEVDRAEGAAQKAEDLLHSGILQGPKGDTPAIGANGRWWISGVDTGVTAEGKDGVTPHIGVNGHWWIGELDTQVQAEGTDGMDADAIRRLYAYSTEELPEVGDRRTFYYIPHPDGGFEVYAWVEYPDGEAAWSPISESTLQQARVDAHGTVRLSTGSVLTEGGIVGVNELGQMLVRPASSAWPGAVKLATADVLAGDCGLVGQNASGQAVVQEAAWNRAGVIKMENGRNTEAGAKVQSNADGLAIVPVAGNRSYGVVATGTAYPVTPHERPYVVSLPIASDDTRLNAAALYGTLTINLHRRGFLRYTAGANAENGLDYATGRYLSFDYGTGLEAEEYTSSIEGMTDSRCRLAVRRYGEIVFHDSYAAADRGGAVKVGGTMRISPEGALDVRTATSAVTGGVKVGDSLVMSDTGVLNARIDDRVNEGSERPASSKAMAAWLKGKNYVSESTLNGRGYVLSLIHISEP
ncbi:hypothetical protein AC781_08685, partial [Akkermansia glycaniphila]